MRLRVGRKSVRMGQRHACFNTVRVMRRLRWARRSRVRTAATGPSAGAQVMIIITNSATAIAIIAILATIVRTIIIIIIILLTMKYARHGGS